ncbi:hypothetical protein JAAARDRAFT_57752 [Jaapia argillacea MUCL 33604]|uniref:MYND-type domain-containing protein n=1 Tax=Jaapia argillacea MUCL 33604 TaxID=933084 RepID=A0A067PTA6_9AGAM|nr:hypothetical protein JAAARDRAFT_57752 [Jaapia argillacea MUCL 33604]
MSVSSSVQCMFCCQQPDRLRRCRACRYAYYCNRECQKSHWKYHRHSYSVAVAARTKPQILSDPPPSDGSGTVRPIRSSAVDNLNKWILTHRDALDLALAHALQLYIFPSRALDHILDIEVEYIPAENSGKRHQKQGRFAITSFEVIAGLPAENEFWQQPSVVGLKSQEERIVSQGGIGCPVYQVTCANIGYARFESCWMEESRTKGRVWVRNWQSLVQDMISLDVSSTKVVTNIELFRHWFSSRYGVSRYATVVVDWRKATVVGEVMDSNDPSLCQPITLSFSDLLLYQYLISI